MIDAKTRYLQTEKNLLDASSFIEPEKIPIVFEGNGWLFKYAGVKYSEIKDDPKKVADAVLKFFDDVEIDSIFAAGINRPIDAYQALGRKDHYIAEDGMSVIHNQTLVTPMGPEVYDLIVEDAEKFIYDTRVRHYFPAFNLPKEDALTMMVDAALKLKPKTEADKLVKQGIIDRGMYQTCQIPEMRYYSTIRFIFDTIRSIKDTLLDLRRRPEKVEAAADAIWFNLLKPNYDKLSDEKYYTPMPFAQIGYHSEGFISPKQYDRFFFQRFKEEFLPYMEKGKKFWLLGEGNFIDKVDRFRDLPKGAIIIKLDKDEPSAMKKAIGDWDSIACGINGELLAVGSKDQCTDYVKKCYDELAPGGGFIFAQNSPLVAAPDGKIENVVASFEMANELGRKR